MTLSSFDAFLCVSSAQLVGYMCITAFNNSWAGICYWVTRGMPIPLEKRHQVLVNVIVTAWRSIARKKIYFSFFFSALMFVLPHSISNNEFLSSRCTKVKLFLVFFFKRYEISRPIVLRIKRVSERKSFFFCVFQNLDRTIKTKIGQR